MVARADMPGDAPRRPNGRRMAAALFLAWRRLLTALLHALRRAMRPLGEAGSRLSSATAAVAGFLVSPAAPRPDASRRRLAIAGVAALALGTVLSVALGRPTRLEAAVSAAWMPLLAVLRLVVMRLAARRLSSAEVRDAWGAALIPQAVAVTDPLRMAALAAWAWLAWGTLAGTAGRAEARRAVAWATGVEAAFWLLRWLGGGALLYLVTRG